MGSALLFGSLLLGETGRSFAQTPESLIKAALVFNLSKVVDWAEGRSGTFVIGTIGRDDADPDFRSIAGKAVHGARVEVVAIEDRADISICRILFVSASEAARLDDILKASRGLGVLTVSEIDGFAKSGGVIQLIRREHRLGFLINTLSAREQGLELSSQLLKISQLYAEES